MKDREGATERRPKGRGSLEDAMGIIARQEQELAEAQTELAGLRAELADERKRTDLMQLHCEMALAEVERLRVELEDEHPSPMKQQEQRIYQMQMYRLPVLGLGAETGDQGIFWINWLNAAEVFAALHDGPPAAVYESLPDSAVICWRERAWVMGP